MKQRFLIKFITAAMLFSIAVSVFAEDAAPVYDADDNSAQQFDGSVNTSHSKSASYVPAQSLTLDQRLGRLEQQINAIQNAETSTKLSELHSEMQALRGQVDQLTHQLQVLQNQQKSMYSDLDKRMSQLPTNKSPSPAASFASSTPTPQPNVAEEQQIYQTAYDLIKAKKYNEAVTVLKKMLKKYPSGQFAASAHYWLGELYGLMGKNDDSGSEFMMVVQNYPDSPKVSDSQLKLGLIYAGQFKWADAKTAFKTVITHYPGTASAHLASEQLKQLKQAGH